MAYRPVSQATRWGLLLVVTTWCLGWPPPAESVSSCTLPTYLYQGTIHSWASRVQLGGRVVGRHHAFDGGSMNVSEDGPEATTREHRYLCHKAVGSDTFIVRETKDNVFVYTCVRFDRWSTNVLQLWASSPPELRSSRALCAESRLEADPWPLVWKQLDQGYVPCPAIGGYDMKVVNSQGTSFCEYINPVPKPRLESECVHGEGMLLEFRFGQCKGDRVPLDRTQRLFCLGHREIGGYNHVVVTDNSRWPKTPKTLMLRYSEVNSSHKIDMHLLEDVVIETTEVISRLTGHIILTKTIFDDLCQDNFHNCLAPETCDENNLKNCRSTCRNFTTCLQYGGSCDFDLLTRGNWMEKSVTGTRFYEIGNHTAMLSAMGSFECFNVYSSTPNGPKPVVKMSTNGCKPRFACLDVEAYSSSILKYRLSRSEHWPFKDNIVRGDLCRETSFTDGFSPFEAQFQNRFSKLLVKAPVPGAISRRATVECNLPNAIRFNVASSSGPPCSGTLRMCQSGHSMVMTFGSECALETPRLFYRCLAAYKTPSQQYLVTERSDMPGEVHCWVRREDPASSAPNVLVQMWAADCTNGTTLSPSVDDIGVPHLLRLQYNAQEEDTNTDACLDILTPATVLPTTTTTSPPPTTPPTPSTTTPSIPTSASSNPSSISENNTLFSIIPSSNLAIINTTTTPSVSPSFSNAMASSTKLADLAPPSTLDNATEELPLTTASTQYANRGPVNLTSTTTSVNMVETTENVSLSSATKMLASPQSTIAPTTYYPPTTQSAVRTKVITSSLRTLESNSTISTHSVAPSTDISIENTTSISATASNVTVNSSQVSSEPQEQLTVAQSSTEPPAGESKPKDKEDSAPNSLDVKSAPVYSRSSQTTHVSTQLHWLSATLFSVFILSR